MVRDSNSEVTMMRGYRAGLGMTVGAALGLLFGLLIFNSWWAPVAGVSIGLLIGAVIDLQSPRGGPTE
jgi:uncharacterized membrane protein